MFSFVVILFFFLLLLLVHLVFLVLVLPVLIFVLLFFFVFLLNYFLTRICFHSYTLTSLSLSPSPPLSLPPTGGRGDREEAGAVEGRLQAGGGSRLSTLLLHHRPAQH